MGRLLIGLDVGGTFTDYVAFDVESGAIHTGKVPSTPDDPAQAAISGLLAVGEPDVVDRIVHGTTVATNATLELSGARVSLITSRGCRDVLEIGRTRRMIDGGLFNPRFRRPPVLVPRERRFEVQERILAGGVVSAPLSAESVASLVPALVAAETEAVAVCLLHSYATPQHEKLIGEVLEAHLPEMPVFLSSDVLPEFREYERMTTTVVNAFVSPMMARYLGHLESALSERRYAATVLTMGSNGGVMTTGRASRLAAQTVLSGPVGGVNGALAVARSAGILDFITCDMGGTSTDVCLVYNDRPMTTLESNVAGYPLKLPQIEINTVGAGGGSIASVESGRLRVGPRSAGAVPGPAAYRNGGTQPTVTDANIVLGRMDTSGLLGGAITIDPGAAERAVRTVARQLGLELHRVAEGIIRLAIAHMAASIREISVLKGYDPRDLALFAYGGAGPMHATQVAAELGMHKVIVPLNPGNLSAYGLLTSDLRVDAVRTFLTPAAAADYHELAGHARRLSDAAVGELRFDQLHNVDTHIRAALDLRYIGQAFELTVAIDDLDTATPDSVRALFETAYESRYGHTNPQSEVEIVNVRVSAYGRTPHPVLPLAQTGEARVAGDAQPTYFAGTWISTPRYDRSTLPAGHVVRGAGLILEAGATTVLEPGWSATVGRHGELIIERNPE